jgi:hypothetical protein
MLGSPMEQSGPEREGRRPGGYLSLCQFANPSHSPQFWTRRAGREKRMPVGLSRMGAEPKKEPASAFDPSWCNKGITGQ